MNELELEIEAILFGPITIDTVMDLIGDSYSLDSDGTIYGPYYYCYWELDQKKQTVQTLQELRMILNEYE